MLLCFAPTNGNLMLGGVILSGGDVLPRWGMSCQSGFVLSGGVVLPDGAKVVLFCQAALFLFLSELEFSLGLVIL